MRKLSVPAIALVGMTIALSCGTPNSTVPPTSNLGFEFPIDCGPITESVLCKEAVRLAASVKSNPPQIAAATLRRPVATDSCSAGLQPRCEPDDVIVVIQSGDTLQEVALIRTSNGWTLHAVMR